MKIEGIGFKEAVEQLAEKANIQLPKLENSEDSIKEEIEKELSQYDNIEDKMLHILKELEKTIRKSK